MTILYTNKDIDTYLDRIDNQKDVLIQSPIFTEVDKIAICKIYEQLTAICVKNLARIIDVVEATQL